MFICSIKAYVGELVTLVKYLMAYGDDVLAKLIVDVLHKLCVCKCVVHSTSFYYTVYTL